MQDEAYCAMHTCLESSCSIYVESQTENALNALQDVLL